MARDTRVPEAVEHVELARLTLEADGVGDEGDLVVVARHGELHGAFVEGREDHRIRRACLGQRQGRQEVLLGEETADACDLAAPDGGGIEVAEVDEHGSGRALGKRRIGADDLDVEGASCHPGAVLEHATVAHDEKGGGGPYLVEHQQLGRELRADARRVTHGQRYDRCSLP